MISTLEICTVVNKPWPGYIGWTVVCVGCLVRFVVKLPKETLIQFGPINEPFEHESSPEMILAVAMKGYRVRVVTKQPLTERAKVFLNAGRVTDVVGSVPVTIGNVILYPNGDLRMRVGAGGELDLGNAYRDDFEKLNL